MPGGLAQSLVSLGKEMELFDRVRTNDPANSVLTAVVLAAPAEPVATLRGYATLATLLAANPEVTNTNYARIELASGDLSAIDLDSTLHVATASLPVLVWDAGGGPAPGSAWDYLALCYDGDSTGGTDANIIPITFHELRYDQLALVPNGLPIVVDLSDGFVRARQGP